jgi:UDPglucose--hexose-1-phosphate uridylyltransferase
MEVAELRTDWLTGRSILVAENREQRPNEFMPDSAAASGASNRSNLALAEIGLRHVPGVPSCPFCAGNEARTPPALYERHDAEGRWQVRVVPNMFPAVSSDTASSGVKPVERLADGRLDTTTTSAFGAHEVIIESAQHLDRTSALAASEMQQVLEAYKDRLRYWRNDSRFDYGLVFKNQGPRAGASIAHLHSQFVALPRVPPAVAAELRRAEEDYRKHGSCAYCRLIERERACGERLVLDCDGYIAFCPFASLQPYEVWLMPEDHEPSFEHASSPGHSLRLANVLRTLIERLERIVLDGAYNMLLRTSPWRHHDGEGFHWRIELIPRINAVAGFEMATGIHINPIAPEKAARNLPSI